jgi:hypothetical protein
VDDGGPGRRGGDDPASHNGLVPYQCSFVRWFLTGERGRRLYGRSRLFGLDLGKIGLADSTFHLSSPQGG